MQFFQNKFPLDIKYQHDHKWYVVDFASKEGEKFLLFIMTEQVGTGSSRQRMWRFYVKFLGKSKHANNIRVSISVFPSQKTEEDVYSFRTITQAVGIADYAFEKVPESSLDISDTKMKKVIQYNNFFAISVLVSKQTTKHSVQPDRKRRRVGEEVDQPVDRSSVEEDLTTNSVITIDSDSDNEDDFEEVVFSEDEN